MDEASRRRRPPVSRSVLLGSGALVVVAVVVSVVTAVLMGPGRSTVGGPGTVDVDAEVAVTDQGTGTPIPPAGELDADTAAALREQIDADALRCRPRGCERWRLPFARSWSLTGHDGERLGFVRDHHAPWPEDEDAAGVLADGGAEVLVVDMSTGEEVFRRVLDRARSEEDVGDISRRWEVLRVHLFGRSVVVVGDRTVTSFGERGEIVWSHGFEGNHLGMVDGTLVTSDEAATGSTVRGHDARDGSERWARASVVVPWLLDAAGLVAVVPDRSEAVTQLVDAATGAEVAEVDGQVVTAARIAAGGTVVLADRTRVVPGTDATDPPRRDASVGAQDLELVAFDRDGAPRWRVPVDDRLVGDVRLALAADGAGITIHHEGDPIDLALETGVRRAVPEGFGGISEGEGWIDALGREVVWTDGSIRVTSDSGWVEVTGRGPWLVHDDPLVVTDGDTLMGVQLGSHR